MLLPNATNGLASGNHVAEATLHALYEIIERDAVTRLSRGGLKKAFEGRARVVDRASVVGGGAVGALHDRLTAAGVKPVLIQVARSEGRRVGKGWCRTCRFRWSAIYEKKKTNTNRKA